MHSQGAGQGRVRQGRGPGTMGCMDDTSEQPEPEPRTRENMPPALLAEADQRDARMAEWGPQIEDWILDGQLSAIVDPGAPDPLNG